MFDLLVFYFFVVLILYVLPILESQLELLESQRIVELQRIVRFYTILKIILLKNTNLGISPPNQRYLKTIISTFFLSNVKLRLLRIDHIMTIL